MRFVFKYLPLEQLHPMALGAATAAECARQQGRFWDMHDRLFADQKQLDAGSLLDRARVLGLNLPDFQRCLGADSTARVRRDAAEARQLGVTGTPTFLIGTIQPDGRVKISHRLSGAVPEPDFRRALDAALNPASRLPTFAVSAGAVTAVVFVAMWIRRGTRSRRLRVSPSPNI